MVASPHYLATEAGVRVLRIGGSAIDAAIATNAVLAVVTPYACGLGGDLFALIYSSNEDMVHGLNGSGRAPAEADARRMQELAGNQHMPARGPLTVTVPGCVEAWGELHRRYGRLAWGDLFSDAVTHAEHGFPVSAEFSRAIKDSASILDRETPAYQTFLPGDVPPEEGQMLAQPRLAETLTEIAKHGSGAFYRGSVGSEVVRALRSVGGLMSLDDLGQHRGDWVEPLSVQYREATVYELPPNSQGIVALLMLAMLQHLPSQPLKQSDAPYVHLLAEVMRLAYADRDAYLTDPEHMSISPGDLLSAKYAEQRASCVSDSASAISKPGTVGDTVYLCVGDGDGNLVSINQSNFQGVGSGVMAGETGVLLHNRGAWFSLDPAHPNVIAPGKRTMHTLMPGLAFKEGRPWLVFGTMGGTAQAEIHVELLTRIIDQGMSVDSAIDAPRFDALVGTNKDGRPLIRLESRFPQSVIDGLEQRGHGVEMLPPYASAMGHAQAIEVLANGVYVGAADPRTHGLALGY